MSFTQFPGIQKDLENWLPSGSPNLMWHRHTGCYPLQAAERDWEEKRASLTQYSAQDINRLLEETQAELMKAIPDLDFAAKQIKPSSNTLSAQIPQSGATTTEHRSSKPQNKLSAKEGGSRRGSGKSGSHNLWSHLNHSDPFL